MVHALDASLIVGEAIFLCLTAYKIGYIQYTVPNTIKYYKILNWVLG